jgi:3'-phosphoadenosine 5'-phosphosulfate sulfotransferase (PAPS reductase)/FAD synthetase
MTHATVFNYGGGRQTVAMCIMIAKGVLPKPDIIVIADTGRENPSTWEYLETHMRPLMREHGLDIQIASHQLATVDLHGHNGDLLLPVFTSTGKLQTYCSNEWKRRVVERHLKTQNVTGGIKWLGLAFDEAKRWKRHHNTINGKWTTVCPLVDYMLNTAACLEVIKAAGYPEPHHSSCWMCPHKRNAEWRHIRDNYPEEWQKAIAIDEEVRAADREQAIWLHHSRVPLAMADIDKDETAKVAQQCSLGVCFV